MSEQIIQWRGTPGVGDAMQMLNVAHRWSYNNHQRVNVEFHWEHGENFLYHPDDPETIVQRTNWIADKYHQNDRVKITHVFKSDRFQYKFWDKQKVRINFVGRDIVDQQERTGQTGAWYNAGWFFKKEELIGTKPKKIVVFNSRKNAEPPRIWKRMVDGDDWIELMRKMREVWEYNVIELTYRHPIETAYRQIQNCDAVICYDGMWHWIARNFCKPMIIPSKEGITSYATPNAIKAKDRDTFLEYFKTQKKFEEESFPKMKEVALKQYHKTQREIRYVGL